MNQTDLQNGETQRQSQRTGLNSAEPIYKSKSYIISRIVIVSLGAFCYGYTWTLFNNLFHALSQEFSLGNNKTQRGWYHGLINCFYLVGGLIGALFAFTLAKMSRIRQFLLCDLLMLFGGIMIITMEINCILIGRFFQGTIFSPHISRMNFLSMRPLFLFCH